MKKKNIFNVVSVIFTVLCLFTLTLFSYYLFKINIVPSKYLITGYGIVLISILVLILLMFGKTKRVIKIISLILLSLLSAGFIYATIYLDNTYHFFKNTQKKDYDTLVYSVVVLRKSSYDEITSLKNKTISYLGDDYKEDIKEELNSKITYTETLVDELGVLSDHLSNNEVDAIVLEEGSYTLVKEEVDNFEESTKVIYTFEVKVKNRTENTESEENVNVTQEPFVLYISGIDQYGNVNSVRGRSDVNQIVIVNPKTNHILLVNTPRDYYVQLAGTSGLRDKLTHAGIYGIDKSISTLENLYGIDINNYLRVNFNTLVKVVDIIGGIDVYSDKTFKSYHIKGWVVNKGMNHFDGKKALAYSRERYAYVDGDHHRGRNQQQVITAIINKVSQSEVLISKYNSILNTLDGSFQTDMPMDMITSFIRYQLDEMPTWNVESIAVTGYGSYNYTYSMGGGRKLYVMEPDYNSVNSAKNRIQEVLNEK